MTMQQKLQAKKSKKGFTLVELVIVIAILAILAAIAIPVITTTINSAKLSTMESDTATLNMLLKEAVNTSKASMKNTKWNGQTADAASVHDVCVENNIDDSTNYYTRHIGGVDYTMNWTSNDNLAIAGGDYTADGTPIEGKNISDLSAM